MFKIIVTVHKQTNESDLYQVTLDREDKDYVGVYSRVSVQDALEGLQQLPEFKQALAEAGK